ncbi:tetratricopeptide repeat protein [Streptomyces aureus]|uniref:tetratricopeptide repeat protein n=1 Tax=Streptomyces aureus TaxID=193461 RepID=UPI00131C5F71|nr:tetratricopeptide repeat protein [Streptomyces aureus]
MPASWNAPALAQPSLSDLPGDAQSLAIALASAVRIEPELIRSIRITVRPTLNVGAETGLWYGPWAAHRGGQYMVLRPPVMLEARSMLVEELRTSRPEDPIRLAGRTIHEAHIGHSPVLAHEEQVTWAALLHDAGITDESQADVDTLLQSFLRTAVDEPLRRAALQRWFTQAWSRFPESVRQTATGLDLVELLGGPGTRRFMSGPLGTPVSDDVPDVVLPVRHDGSKLGFGDFRWPSEGILVPDTQPRILHVSSRHDAWGEAQEVRVPRGGFTACPAHTVPMFVRTARGQIYRVGAPGEAEVVTRPPTAGRLASSRLLGQRIEELTDADARYFGIPIADLNERRAASVRTLLAPYQARRIDSELRQRIGGVPWQSKIILVRGKPHSGRTRTLWEAMRHELAEWWAWAPALIDRNECVLKALADDGVGSQTVVWLDDLDESLAAPGGEELAEALLELLDDPSRYPVAVLGTIRDGTQLLSRMGPAATSLLHKASTVDLNRSQGWPGAPRPRAYPRTTPESEGLPPVVVGRQQELQRLLHALDPSTESRAVVVLTGAAGIGKSVLAARAAQDACARDWFPGGLLIVTLTDKPSLWMAIARQLGLNDPATPAHAQTWSTAQLKLIGGPARRVLILLHNARPADIAQVTSAMPAGYALIATSQHAPGDTGLDIIDVGSLPQPEATQLLEALLLQHDRNDTRADRDHEATADVAKLCGGFPLALATAATWLTADPRRTMRQLLKLLEFESALGLEHHGELPVRHALDVTFHGASPAQQKALCSLALLPGSEFATATVKAALNWGSASITLLDELAQRHLIAPTATAERWQIPSLLQIYGQAVIGDHLSTREIRDTRARIVAYYRTRAANAERALWSQQPAPRPGRTSALEWMRVELSNVAAVARWCFANEDPLTGTKIAMSAARFIFQEKQHAILLELMNQVERWANDNGHLTLRAAALSNIAVSFAANGDLVRAREILAFVTDLSRSVAGMQNVQIVVNMGAILISAHQTQEAIDLLSEAISQNRSENPAATVLLLCNLSTALLQAANHDEAIATLQAAEDLAQQHPLPLEEKGPLFRSLGNALKATGHLDRAAASFTTALEAYLATGDLSVQALLHQDLASLYLQAEKAHLAIPHLKTAITLFQQLNDPESEAEACQALAETFRVLDRHSQALDWFKTARTLHQSNNNEEWAAQALRAIGVLLLQTGRPAESIPALRSASAHLEILGVQHGQARALRSLAQACIKEDNLLEASSALIRCADLYSQLTAEQAYPTALPREGQSNAGLAEQAQRENALRDETHTLITEILRVSHRLEAAGLVDEAYRALSAVELLGQPSKV